MLSSTQNYVVYQGNGATTSFPFNFIIPNAGSLVVSITNNNVNPPTTTILASNQYTVTGLGTTNEFISGSGSGGAVTYPVSGSPLAAGYSITIQRIVPLQQNTSLSNQGAFYPQVVEAALDYLTMAVQQIAAGTSGTSPVLPAWISGINTLVGSSGAVNSATPTLAGLYPVYKTANTSSTAITGFTNMVPGHYFKVIFGDTNTTVGFGYTGATVIGNNSTAWTPGVGDFMDCVTDGTYVYCITSGTLATLTSYINSQMTTAANTAIATAMSSSNHQVSVSRSGGTLYQNTQSKPMNVFIICAPGGSGATASLYVGPQSSSAGLEILSNMVCSQTSTSTNWLTWTGVVPENYYYVILVSAGSFTVESWIEQY